MEIKELRKKNESELVKFLKLKREEFRYMRFRISAKQHKDVRELREVKKLIARVLTVIREKQLIKKFKKNTKE